VIRIGGIGKMTKSSAYLASVSVALGLLCAPATAKFITFQPPGATVTTAVTAITNSGEVIGSFEDASGTLHGFLRAADGTFTTIDFPGAKGTYPTGMSHDGTIVGYYTVKARSLNPQQGFIRTPDGQISAFHAPHANRFTNVVAITDTGWIVGQAYAAHDPYNSFGFLRDPSGHFTKFGQQWLQVICANSARTTAGTFRDQSGAPHGFVRTRNGKVTQVDPDDSVFTHVTAINDSGAVAGLWAATDFVRKGFVRAANGTISTFVANQDGETLPWSMNKAGTIVGTYDINGGVGGGFVRPPDGRITTFTVPGSFFTDPEAINDKGQIAGQATMNGGMMGFIGKP